MEFAPLFVNGYMSSALLGACWVLTNQVCLLASYRKKNSKGILLCSLLTVLTLLIWLSPDFFGVLALAVGPLCVPVVAFVYFICYITNQALEE